VRNPARERSRNLNREVWESPSVYGGEDVNTREEWAGTDAVFDAIDINHDGKISPDEIAVGLGAAFRLVEA
jgi:hypothetical protein